MTPAELLQDHERRPRNLGRLADAHGHGTVGSIVAGRALRVFVTLDGAGRIALMKHQVFNAADQAAAASVLSELLPGRTPAEARALGPADLAAHLGGLDWKDLPPQIWAFQALGAALDQATGCESDWQGDREPYATPLVCRCHGVDEARVLGAIADGATSVQAIEDATLAASGCGSCRRELQRLLDEANGKTAAKQIAPIAPRSGPGGRIALLRQIQGALAATLGQYRDAGLHLELWDLDSTRVLLKAPADADPRLKEQAEDRLTRLLKDQVDPLLRIDLL
jgi:bacterioferritin-associated ferredoxin/NifU-like protein involved in Fe-S cluster formation